MLFYREQRRKRILMTKKTVLSYLNKNAPPCLFGAKKSVLYNEYDRYLDQIEIRNEDDRQRLVEILEEYFKTRLIKINRKSMQDYQEGLVEQEDMMLAKVFRKGEEIITNIPVEIADWIGLIAYVKTKYTITAKNGAVN